MFAPLSSNLYQGSYAEYIGFTSLFFIIDSIMTAYFADNEL